MNTSDFWYDLPEELIAQTPLKQRDASRLLHLDKTTGAVEHRHFTDLLDYLRPGDCLILNDTRVLPARIYGVKEETGALVEFLLLKQKELDVWECLCKPGKRAKPGTTFTFGEGLLQGDVLDITDDGGRLVKFSYEGNFYAILEEIGQMPLPPYIKEKLEDRERYQTVYSNELGSAAAPTAGLHFTPELLQKVEEMGVSIGKVTLHVGLGTFRPVKVDNIEDHKMHSEHYWMPKETADLINRTKEQGGRVIAVGTTSCRTLESVATKLGH
ncbi:MAG: tRNA preQ1(34) S-adenosylmethionine ribosyltransferase-isomerase QueA, partial [Clostridia bacterium]|nr:tRNA preQ1(34) S-adenosylmethionine ribosyltransferase-isomerase QueA [Clostridia bacterium]